MLRRAVICLMMGTLGLASSLAQELPPGDSPPRTRLLDEVVVADAPDAVRTDLPARVRSVQRGYEAMRFAVREDGTPEGRRWVVYDTARRRIIALTDRDAAAWGAAGESRKAPSAAPDAPSCRDAWPGIERWRSLLGVPPPETGKSASSRMPEGLHAGGYACYTGADGRGETRLYCRSLDQGEPADLGALRASDGAVLTRVHHLKVFPSGDVAVVASDGHRTLLQVYEAPLVDALTACAQRFMETAHRRSGLTPVAVRSVVSLYEFAEQADRGFDSMAAAGDGCVYFGTMPHHPEKGTPVLRFSPKDGRVASLGDFDALAANGGTGHIPSMMHSAPVELSGKLYFLGQDPFYGRYEFPGMSADARYAGSPLLLYDLTEATFEPLGNPLPKGPSVFAAVADGPGRTLYLRQGYWQVDWRWHRLPMGVDGRPAAPPVPLPLERQPSSLHVAPDGKLYFCVRRAAIEGLPIPPQWDVCRYDPKSGRSEIVAFLDTLALTVPDALTADGDTQDERCDWIAGQEGSETVFGYASGMGLVFRFDTASGKLGRAFAWPLGTAAPAHFRGTMRFHEGRIYWFHVDGRERPFPVARLMVADAATGNVTRYGALRDQRGRWVHSVTQAVVAADGRFCLGGQVWGAPGDRLYCRRGRAAMPVKLDSAFMVLEDLPQ